MERSELPPSTRIVVSSDAGTLKHAFDRIFGKDMAQFFWLEPVTGTSRSERLISTTNLGNGAQLTYLGGDTPTTEDLALELMALSLDPKSIPPARYDPEQPPSQESEKGWEILITHAQNEPVALARAVWV